MNNNHVLFILLVVVLVCVSLGHPLVAAAENGGMFKKCIDKERDALLDFKAHLRDPYDHLSTWGAEEDDCCKWNGVSCNNQTGQVIGLHLNANEFMCNDQISLCGFEGEISPSLLNLTNLTYLELSANSFSGTIPAFIGSLSELRELDLSFNYFNGTIPPEIGNLTNLQDLDFGNLTCTIENPDWLYGLSRLKYLDLEGVSLAKADNWVNVILSLKKLILLRLFDCDLSHVMHPYSSSSSINSSSSSIEIIHLGYNNLNSSMYHWLFPLTSNKLHTLDFSNNILDRIPKYLGNLCSLRTLGFYNNSLAVSFSDLLNTLSGCASLTLQELRVSHNQLTGSLFDEIKKFSSLEEIDLSYNQLNGSISEKIWEHPKLQILDLSSNFLRGHISLNIGKSKILVIDLANNPLVEGVPSKAHMSKLSYVQEINLSFCKLLGPHFPKWIQALKNLTGLNMANAMISDTVPAEFWNTWPSRLNYLNLSSNNITGKVPDLISNFNPEYSRIDLSSNNFFGPIPNVPSTLNSLDLSNNKFSGGISFLCQIDAGFLKYLDLSNNSLTGQIPDCLWHFKKLKLLNLGHNYLSGRLPPSVEFLIELEVLYLCNNDFSGELPLSLKSCTNLTFLNLGTNRFSGTVPYWIGENLSELNVISLTSNNFFGTIPFQLCQLVNLQILDLSKNNLDGIIPPCVSNLTAMVQDGFSQNQIEHYYNWGRIFSLNGYEQVGRHFVFTYGGAIYVDHATIMWKGSLREFRNTLGLVKTIDLSNNNLTGQIPYELINLYQLVSLNLSTNALQGEIPQKIGHMKELEILDLSNNNLSGELPSSMSEMTSLNYLDLSNNNLSGKIPSSTQLQTFEPSRFTGNAGLCGPPVTKSCPEDDEFQSSPTVGESEGHEEGKDELEKWFYIGEASGFATGFWIACSALLLNRRGRHVFFSFVDNLRNWVYVKVMVSFHNLGWVAHA